MKIDITSNWFIGPGTTPKGFPWEWNSGIQCSVSQKEYFISKSWNLSQILKNGIGSSQALSNETLRSKIRLVVEKLFKFLPLESYNQRQSFRS